MNRKLKKLQCLVPIALASAGLLLASMDDAQDIVQDSLLAAAASKNMPSEQKEIKLWFFRIVRNKCFDELRFRRRFDVSEKADLAFENKSHSPCPGITLENQQLAEILDLALMQLSFEHREILVLKDMNDFSYQEIAKVLDIAKGTVMSRLSRARNALRVQVIVLIGDENLEANR